MNAGNHLAGQKSPYLIKHSDNPVDWYPWTNEAFAKAIREDKPIFLSIGYSTCHWCHVMERESFENITVAKLLNESFVSIKVDREERPDIDKVYMNVCQLLTGSGGWPLTIIMTPEKKPFFAATYIPRENRFGMLGLIELLNRISALWHDQRTAVNISAESATEALRKISVPKKGGIIGADVFDRTYDYFATRYDAVNGGFGTAPKFPSPHNFLFLLRYGENGVSEHARIMTLDTLRHMRLGGMYDQIGFGFHRYTTDEQWLVPHFEKMLYDQAMLALAFTEAYQASDDPFYVSVVEEIFDYVLRDMTSSEGGFYSAEDADSEGREGTYYLWTVDEIVKALGEADAKYTQRILNLVPEGNFLDEALQKTTGANIPHLKNVPNEREKFDSIRKKLLAAREKRVRPAKDDTILTDWNGLMIAALARGAALFENDRYRLAAEKSAAFIIATMLKPGDRLLHRYRDGEASIPGNLDDYAFFVWGLIELYEQTFAPEYLDLAVCLTESMLVHFSEKDGSLVFSPLDAEEIITKLADYSDGAYPSGNAVAFYNLIRLSRLTGNAVWEERASMILQSAADSLQHYPQAHTMFLAALHYARGESCEVVLAGSASDAILTDMIRELRRYSSRCAVIVKFSDRSDHVVNRLAPFTREMSAREGKSTAYVCKKNQCYKPVHTVAEMLDLIKTTKPLPA
jgi:uncharacterized protein YyaL (SSP411 family)